MKLGDRHRLLKNREKNINLRGNIKRTLITNIETNSKTAIPPKKMHTLVPPVCIMTSWQTLTKYKSIYQSLSTSAHLN